MVAPLAGENAVLGAAQSASATAGAKARMAARVSPTNLCIYLSFFVVWREIYTRMRAEMDLSRRNFKQ
jgi:hypothetical protein